MFSFKKIRIKRIKKVLSCSPRILVENILLTFLGFLVISLIMGSIIFFQANASVKASVEEVKISASRFDDKSYQEFLANWQTRSEIFVGTNSKTYPNPFRVGR